MNMFGVGPLELAVVLIVALVFVGPDRLPRLAADLARMIKEVRKYTNALASEFNEVVKDVERETTGEKSIWRDVTDTVGGATQQVTTAVREVRQDIMKSAEPLGSGDATTPGVTPSATNGHATGDTAAWVDIADPDAQQAAVTAPAIDTPASAAAEERVP